MTNFHFDFAIIIILLPIEKLGSTAVVIQWKINCLCRFWSIILLWVHSDIKSLSNYLSFDVTITLFHLFWKVLFFVATRDIIIVSISNISEHPTPHWAATIFLVSFAHINSAHSLNQNELIQKYSFNFVFIIYFFVWNYNRIASEIFFMWVFYFYFFMTGKFSKTKLKNAKISYVFLNLSDAKKL